MIDALCEDGYTINFYPRNVPPPKKWIEKGCSLTHSRIIVTLDALPNKYYTCGMNNLFISEKFFRAAYAKTKSQTMVPGVFRKKFVDYPTLLYKKILQKIENDDIMRGKKKADVLEGDVECPDIVEFSVYDTNMVHFLWRLSSWCRTSMKSRSITRKLIKRSG